MEKAHERLPLNPFQCDENLEIPPDFLGWADKLILNATKINEYEEEHNERMREILSEKLGTILLVADKNARTIWKGTDENGKSIVIKYTSKYCVAAFNICATAGFAPELLYCSDDAEARRFGEFRMIIMEYLDGTALDQRFNKEETMYMSHGLTIYRNVKCAIEELYNKNFMFADLCPPNILIFGTGEELHTNLIDLEDTIWTVIHHQ
ncbi:hypothetical protein C1646_795044 [Rhizophagus diaphanus]|nr:hypothetical protein C1646_795044 [Rhizophagus diaphanus] [Rhizophagus sp. MUCL 43196]